MRNKAARWRNLYVVVAGLVAAVAAAGCGPSGFSVAGGLSGGDKRVCADAVQDDAVAVYMDGPGATNSDIQKQAALITMTSAADVDEKAVQSIVQICKNKGYQASSGVSANGQSTGAPTTGGMNASAQPSGARYTKPPAHGILEFEFIGANGQITNFQMLDPNTGKVVWQFEPAAPPAEWDPVSPRGSGMQDAVYGTPPYDSEMYSTDMRRVAARGPHYEVGWIDLATGAVTDITREMPAPSPAFGQPASTDRSPLFDPHDNSFWFERTGSDGSVSVLRVPPGGSHAEKIATLSDANDRWGISNSGELVNFGALARSVQFATIEGVDPSNLAVNPSGSIALACGNLNDASCYIQSPLGAQWQPLTFTGPDSSALQGASGQYGWINDKTLIGPGSANTIDMVTIAGLSATVAGLIPSGQARCADFVASPDGDTVFFAAASPGTPQYFYKTSLSAPGSAPNQVGPVPQGTTGFKDLLAWRATGTPSPTTGHQSPSPVVAPSASYSLYSSPNPNFPPLFYQFPVPRLGPSYGLVTLAFFISADKFTPPGPPLSGVLMTGLGDGRGFASDGLPDPGKARVIFSLDFSTGQGLMRVNTSCVQVATVAGGAAATACGGPNTIVPWQPSIPFGDASTLGVNDVLARGTPQGLLLELAASNGAAFPYGSWLAGEIDAQLAFRAEPHGNLKIAAQLKGFPSTEAYQIVNGQLRHTLIQVREQNWNSADAMDQSPDLSALKSPPPSTSTVYCTDPKFC